MLVLTRKSGEGIAIGDDIKIVVMQIKGKQVRLGIKASSSTTVHREEIYNKILEENKEASSSTLVSLNAIENSIKPSNFDQTPKTAFRRKEVPK